MFKKKEDLSCRVPTYIVYADYTLYEKATKKHFDFEYEFEFDESYPQSNEIALDFLDQIINNNKATINIIGRSFRNFEFRIPEGFELVNKDIWMELK